MESADEIPVAFDCCGSTLFGIVHSPQEPIEYGLLTVVAGGPQYRAGCGRQLLTLAREMADSGIPVMRFDQRGVGDSHGDFLGFENMEEDIRAAVALFKAHVPAMKYVVLWGGCDAGSSVLLNAWKIPEVRGAIVANPFVSSSTTQKTLRRKHYLNRFMEKSFWKKLLTLQYNPLEYLTPLKAKLLSAAAPVDTAKPVKQDKKQETEAGSFADRMLRGLQEFDGQILFLMSGHSPTRREFDEFLTRFPAWKKACSRSGHQRLDLVDADQTFSTRESREAVNTAALNWMKALNC
jgi:exosortase A-associated hydrolase 1